MDPSEFLNFPIKLTYAIKDGGPLSISVDESIIRTGIGRCYYAAFLIGRNKLGLFRGSYRNIHHRVINEFKKRGRYDIASKLFELRKLRTNADYDLNLYIDKDKFDHAFIIASELISKILTA